MTAEKCFKKIRLKKIRPNLMSRELLVVETWLTPQNHHKILYYRRLLIYLPQTNGSAPIYQNSPKSPTLGQN